MRSKSTDFKLRPGFGLIEMIIGIVLLAGISGGIIGLLQHSDAFLASEIYTRSKEATTTDYQINAQEGQNIVIQTHSLIQGDKGRLGINLKSVTPKDTTQERVSSSQCSIVGSGEDIQAQSVKLLAPIVNSSTKLKIEDFPIKVPFTFPFNPYGTYHKYTIDGSEPTDNSLIWKHSPITLANVSKILTIRAFHRDHIPSDIAFIEFDIDFNLSFEREDGSKNSTVSITEIQTDKNKILLTCDAPLDEVDIWYGYEEDEETIPYIEAFHIPLNNWKRGEAKVYVKVKPKSPDYEIFQHQEFIFTIAKEKLPKPKIHSPKGLIVHKGDRVEIKFDFKNGETRTSIDETVTIISSSKQVFILE